MKTAKVIILGSGPAGCTAAIYAARAGLSPVLISGPVPGGQLTKTSAIENWPGEKSISGYDLMEKLMDHAKSLGTEFVSDTIVSADFSGRPLVLKSENETYEAQALIIATGAEPRWLGLPSEAKFMGNGVSACATCDGFFYRDQDTAVVGGGNTALSDALYLANLARQVYLIHRRDEFRAEKTLVDRVQEKVKEGKITLVLNAEVKEILGNDLSGVSGIKAAFKDGTEKEIPVTGVFVAIGHLPNSSIFANLLETDHGIVKTGYGAYKTGTSVPGVFAAGDVQDPLYRQAITSAGTGCMAAQDAARYLKEAGIA